MMAKNKIKKSRRRVDPQGAIRRERREFETVTHNKFVVLRREIRKLLVEDDVYGITPRTPSGEVSAMFNARTGEWANVSEQEKLTLFREWLRDLMATGEASIVDGYHGPYIESAHLRGMQSVELSLELTTEADGLAGVFSTDPASFAAPKRYDSVERFYAKTLNLMQGLTDDVGKQMTDILSTGFIEGRHSRVIAARMSRALIGLEKKRAIVIAQTEMARAYAEGQLDGFEAARVDTVQLFAEWSTAGDDRVCPKCQPMDGKILKIEEARGLIPLHPRCRCAWIPITPADMEAKRKRERQAILDMRKKRWERENGKTPKAPTEVGSAGKRSRTQLPKG